MCTKRLQKLLLALIPLVLAISAAAQTKSKYKPWTEWSLRDAEKLVNDSAWAQTQTETQTQESMIRSDLLRLHLRVRLLSAKPIRQAFLRILQLKRASEQRINQAIATVDRTFPETIVVAVNYEGTDGPLIGPIVQTLSGGATNILQNNTYLEPKGGERVYLQGYQPPGEDQLGAKFVFPRFVNGQPFITATTNWLRFYTQLPMAGAASQAATYTDPSRRTEAQILTINVRFKVADFLYAGVLEY